MGKSNKSRPIFGLNKISNNDLLQLANIEISKLKSYIDELEHNKRVLENRVNMLTRLTPQEYAAVKREFQARKLEKSRTEKIKQLEKRLSQRNEDYDELMCKYCLLKQKYGE